MEFSAAPSNITYLMPHLKKYASISSSKKKTAKPNQLLTKPNYENQKS